LTDFVPEKNIPFPLALSSQVQGIPMVDEAPVTPTEELEAAPTGNALQKYLDQAVEVLDRFGISVGKEEPSELINLLEQVRDLDEAKVLAIGRVIQHMSTFNTMVRENVENIVVGNRYLDITKQFDSIREDSKTLLDQLEDGKISITEKMSNLWMRLRRGTPSDRFDELFGIYKEVSKDTKDQLTREQTIMNGYIDFRFALKEAEVLARDLVELQIPNLQNSQQALADAQANVDGFTGDDDGDRSRLELKRDEARHAYENEDRRYQLVKDIAENLSIGYDVGETLVTKLKQTHDVKEQVYRRAVTFFTTNEHVFTILGTVYTSSYGLNEVTQATEAMKEGVNKGLEDIADLSRDLERAALRAGYGSTISPDSVQKLVDAISSYQVESLEMIAELRKESEANAKEIRKVVEEGKHRFQDTLAKFARDASA